MKITQRMRRPAGRDDEQIAGIRAADADIVLIRRPVPFEYAEIVARGRVGEVRFHTTARGAKNKIERGLDHLESILHRSPALERGSRRLSVAIDRADWLTAASEDGGASAPAVKSPVRASASSPRKERSCR